MCANPVNGEKKHREESGILKSSKHMVSSEQKEPLLSPHHTVSKELERIAVHHKDLFRLEIRDFNISTPYTPGTRTNGSDSLIRTS